MKQIWWTIRDQERQVVAGVLARDEVHAWSQFKHGLGAFYKSIVNEMPELRGQGYRAVPIEIELEEHEQKS